MKTEQDNFKTIYDLEAEEFSSDKNTETNFSLAVLLLKASGIFISITFIVFSIANYQFIKSQLVDWRREDEVDDFVEDSDGDSLPDWWEKKYGLNPEDHLDSLDDTDNDFLINIIEYQHGTDPTNPDSDGDGYFDGEELRKGYNPNGLGRLDSDGDGMPDFWEDLYGLDKTDKKDATQDLDNDGLINSEEFKYNTNPRRFDTDSDGYSDGVEVIKRFNPSGGGVLTKSKKFINSKDEDEDNLEIEKEVFFGTDPKNPDSDADGFSDFDELFKGYDPTGEGKIKAMIQVPAIGISAPIIFSEKPEEDEIQKDLSSGVIHFPGTPIPGMRGNSYVTGHSSYYSWSKSQYKEVFKDLGDLKKGDKIIFHYEMANGKKLEIIYGVSSSEVVKADDRRLFRDFEGHELTLVTCWPIGTDWKRLMVKANLEKPEY